MSQQTGAVQEGVCKGMQYTFTLRAVPSPMAYRSRASLPGGARISGFGNTRETAVKDMMNRIRAWVELREQQGWA